MEGKSSLLVDPPTPFDLKNLVLEDPKVVFLALVCSLECSLCTNKSILCVRRKLTIPFTDIVTPGLSKVIPGEGMPKPGGGKVVNRTSSQGLAIVLRELLLVIEPRLSPFVDANFISNQISAAMTKYK